MNTDNTIVIQLSSDCSIPFRWCPGIEDIVRGSYSNTKPSFFLTLQPQYERPEEANDLTHGYPLVSIEHGFYISERRITGEDFHLERSCGLDSFTSIETKIRSLNENNSEYRMALPSEVQWEYAWRIAYERNRISHQAIGVDADSLFPDILDGTKEWCSTWFSELAWNQYTEPDSGNKKLIRWMEHQTDHLQRIGISTNEIRPDIGFRLVASPI